MDNESHSLSKEFKEEIADENKIFPFKKKLLKDLDTNNFLLATIHCLLNIKKLSIYFLNSDMNNEYGQDPYITKLDDILNSSNDDKFKHSLMELKQNIYYKIHFNSRRDIGDPRKIINFILENFKKYGLLPDCILTTYKCEKCNNYLNHLNIITFNIPKVIEYIEENNKKFINSKNITMKDCFNFYFKSLNNYYVFDCDKYICQNGKKSINKLPKILIIYIDYGNDKNAYYDYSYEFKEEFYSKEFFDKDSSINNYYLSSMIACQNIGTYFELYYTLVKEESNSNYSILNGNDTSRSIPKVTKYLKKEKINLKDKKQSWPFVLIYVDKNIDNDSNSKLNLIF